jgi:uncharacterized protein (DUF362 family)
LTRRDFFKIAATGGVAAAAVVAGAGLVIKERPTASVFIARAKGYEANILQLIGEGFKALKVNREEVFGKRILLKPNLVEPRSGSSHVNTHPLVVQAAAEAFLQLGAKSVVVAEGSGHELDSYLVLEKSGYAEMLHQQRIRFVDLNVAAVAVLANLGKNTQMCAFVIPQEILRTDMIVSMAKMKTHHWVGVTLSMKNLLGILPGAYYGWPKNLLHMAGINESILDINATIKPSLAIVDGIVGMEGDGPIMGTPVNAGCLIMGRNLAAVDATCARIMGVDPEKIDYLNAAPKLIGPIREARIEQRGETIASVHHDFQLIDEIPAQKDIRLKRT